MKTLIMLLALASTAMADWKNEVTPAKLGSHPKLVPQEFEYRLSWKGMVDAGKLTFTFGKRDPKFPSDYAVRVSGGSTGIASKLYKNKVAVFSRLDPATLRPRVCVGVQDEGDEVNTTRTTWSGPVVKSEQTITITKNGKTATVGSEFKFTPVHDVCSAMLHVRSHKLDDGDTLVLPLQPFNRPYLLRVHVQGREKFAGRDTIKLSVGLQKIDPNTKALLPYKKLKSATLWLSDDANRIPVELRSEVFIGDVRMTLAGAKRL
ncbi:DUF3108 domain-containing protein [Luteolibacter sp. GHJ8]|uniref:DUF3108 domain-containing protein n=1 Tax=Luteolibacter rhizosphaerae TaxID=2989719 RepID=A0ABT3G1P4_9BACT|nr:DUF3108 domain-containing protein [Luteolibacter rhizosphaerae]MCW1913763.1 DUF3108 domain-containing protein [Luteolibacter rhizosphaerae]